MLSTSALKNYETAADRYSVALKEIGARLKLLRERPGIKRPKPASQEAFMMERALACRAILQEVQRIATETLGEVG